MSHGVDLEQCTVKAVSSDLEKYNHVGRLWTLQKSLPWRDGPSASGVFCRSLIKNPAGLELPLWRLSCNFTRTDGGRDLAMEDKGTPCAVGVSSSPMRGRTAKWVPGDTWRWVLLYIGDVTVCYQTIYWCCRMWVQGSELLAKGVSRKMDWA